MHITKLLINKSQLSELLNVNDNEMIIVNAENTLDDITLTLVTSEPTSYSVEYINRCGCVRLFEIDLGGKLL